MLTGSAWTRVPLLSDTLITLIIFLLSAGLGFRALRLLRVHIPDSLERGLFAVTLGLGALTFVPFTLFALGLGRPPVLAGVTLLLFLLVLPDAWRVVRASVRGTALRLRGWRKQGLNETWLLAAALAPFLLLIYLNSLCPPTDPDGLHYHLTAPLRYLDFGRFEYIPTFLHLNWPLGVEMLFSIGLAFHAHYPASPIEMGFGLLLLLSAFAFTRRIASPAAGWFAAALTFYQIRNMMPWAYIDLGLCQYTLLAVFAFFLGWQKKQDSGETFPTEWKMAGLLGGMAASTKLTGLLTLLLLTCLAFMGGRNRHIQPVGAKFRAALSPALGVLAFGLLMVGPWYIRSWVMTGDPMYPFLWKFFPSLNWDADAHARLSEYLKYFISLPSWRLTPAQVNQVRLAGCAAILAASVPFLLWRATRAVRPLVLFFFAALFLQVATGGIYMRYLYPILIPGTILLCWTLSRLLPASAALRWTGALLMTALLWSSGQIKKMENVAREATPAALGLVSREAYLARRIPIFAPLDWANKNLPPDATVVLGVWHEAYGSLLHRRALYTQVWLQNAVRFTDWETLLQDLHRYNASYLLMKKDAMPPPERSATLSREERVRVAMEFPKLLRLRDEYGEPLFEANDYVIYALRWERSKARQQSADNVLLPSP